MRAMRFFTPKTHHILRYQLSSYSRKRKVKEEADFAKKSASREVLDYLEKRGLTENEIANISPSYFKQKFRTSSSFLIVDKQLAKYIALTICARIKGKHVLEFDAGIGIMSEILLPLCENLRLYAPNSELAEYLRVKFQHKLNNKLKIFDRSISNILGILYSKAQDPESFYTLVEGLPCQPWTEDISVSMITPVTNINFIKSLVANLVDENSLKQFGRPEFFFLLPSNVAEPLLFKESCLLPQIPIHFLFNIFFDVTIIRNNLPRNAFLPWPSPKDLKKRSIDTLYLVHAIPKLDKFEPYLDNRFLSLLSTFVRSALRQRKRIIPTFESFVPNCGARFIVEDGLNIYTEFHEITPDTFFHIFKKLTSYPEFDTKLVERDECEAEEGEPDPNDVSDSEDSEISQD